jgi:hypothetical protein
VAAAAALLSHGAFWRVEPDYSLFLVRNVEFATRPHWHLVTAYGPFAFLFRGYHPANYAWLVLLWSAFAVLTVLLLRDDPIVAATIVVVLAADPRPGLLLVFPLIVYAKRASRPLALAGVAAMALMGLIKSSALTLGLIVTAALSMELPIAAAVYVASFLAFWFVAGQDASWLWPFLRGTWHIASAYGEAEVGGAMSWSAGLLLFVALIVIFWRRKDVPVLILVLFAFAKTALVRNDVFHEALWPMAVLTLLMLYAPRWAAVAAIAIVAPYLAPSELGRQVVAMANPIAAKRTSDALYARDLASIRARVARPPVDGTVDVYGNWQSVAIAYGLEYRPRPVFQSYIAYDAALASMNAQHLRDEPPQSILFAINYTDGRYPALDDALSWPELLTHYTPVAASRDFVAMRRTKPRTLRVVAARTLHGRLGEPLAIPPAALLWAEVHVETKMLGKLLAFAYKLPELRIAVNGVEGRFLRRTAAAGFLLSPIVTQPRELYGGQRAQSMTIRGGGLYERDFTVVVKELLVE